MKNRKTDYENEEDEGEDLYEDEGMEEAVEDDEISSVEEAFMRGYKEAGKKEKEEEEE